MGDADDIRLQPERGLSLGHFSKKHIYDLRGLAIAEELAERFFMIGDAVFCDQLDKVPLGVAGQRGFGEMRVFAEEVLGRAIHIGEVAAPAAGNTDFFARFLGMIYDERVWPSVGGAHEASGACA